jgi:hypothetical protein
LTLLVNSTDIPSGIKVTARWVEPFIPATAGHKGTHEKGGFDEIDVTKLKNYQETIATPLADNTTHSINGKKLLSINAFPRIIPEASDSARIQRVVDAAEDGSTIVFSDTDIYEVTSTVSNLSGGVYKKLSLIAYKAKFKATANGLNIIFKITDVSGFSISGLHFDQNLIGRTTFEIARCSNFTIDKCYFTGYSKQYGYSSTDSAIRITDCTNAKIMFNTWENHGDQYTSATADLNRCITIQGTSDNITVMGNTFNKVNQAIVVAGGRHLIIGNTFTEVHDNVLYQVGAGSDVIFNGNHIDHRYDEAIVVDYGSIIMSSNKIKNVPNKVLAVGGNLSRVIFHDNVCENPDITQGQFIVWRDNAYLVDYMSVKNNNFRCLTNSTTNDYFIFGNVTNLFFEGNRVHVASVDNQRILYFTVNNASWTTATAYSSGVIVKSNGNYYKASTSGTSGATAPSGTASVSDGGVTWAYLGAIPAVNHTAKVINNNVTGATSATKSIEVSSLSASPDIYYADNETSNCRGVLSGVKPHNQKVTYIGSTYIYSKVKRLWVFVDAQPTSGSWSAGDYAELLVPTVNGTAGSKYVLKGYKRITTGTGNVLNTDWVEDRALTGQ